MNSIKDLLLEKINNKKAHVAVIGMGYVGLPLAVELVGVGFSVLGVDISDKVVARINSGDSHVGDVSSDRLGHLVRSGMLKATKDYSLVSQADIISICVPTPLTKNKDPDISYITDAMNSLLPYVRQGQLVVLESTTYPGTTEDLIAKRLEVEKGLMVGSNIFVAFSPERVDPGNPIWNTKNTPKVVGGVTSECTDVARLFYSTALSKIHVVGSAKEAETVKLLENTFRAVNIGLVNEFMLMCDRLDIDIWNVIDAAATKPFGFMPFYPGPGIGGHCIPLDPLYLSWTAKSVDFYNRFIELASDINSNMPQFVIRRLADLLNDCEKPLKNSRILILGMAYKADINDLRESPGLEIYRMLCQKGCLVEFHDPHVKSFISWLGNTVKSTDLTPGMLKTFDAVLLVTDHKVFDYKLISQESILVLDCRNAFGKRGIKEPNVVKL